jgi:hypothetical protein
MNNDQTIAVRVKINVAGSGGKINQGNRSTKKRGLLKSISGGLSKILKTTQKGSNMQMSGLLGGSALGGLGFLAGLGALIGGLVTMVLGTHSPQNRTDSLTGLGYYNNQYQYEKIEIEEQTYVAEIDKKTGEITDLMSVQEAFQKELVDSYGNAYEDTKVSKESKWNILSDYEKQKSIQGAILKELESEEEMTKYNTEQIRVLNKTIQDSIDAQKRIKEMIAEGPSIDYSNIESEASATEKINANPVLRNNWLIGGDEIASVVKATAKKS